MAGCITGAPGRTQVQSFWSSDPKLSPASWKIATIIQLPSNGTHLWTAFNTSPTRAKLNGEDVFVLAIELGGPAKLVGVRFTSVFAVCKECAVTGDLSKGWTVLDPTTHIYIKAHYSACPTLRYYDGYFYLITVLENLPNPKGPKCNSKSTAGWSSCLAEHIVRSKDLQTWEESPINGSTTIIMGLPDGDDLSGPDHRIIPGSLLDQFGTAYEKDLTHNQTDDINRSDMDMVTLPNGQTYVVWASGNQGSGTAGNPPMGMSVAGLVNGTEQAWVESFFQ